MLAANCCCESLPLVSSSTCFMALEVNGLRSKKKSAQTIVKKVASALLKPCWASAKTRTQR